MSYPHRYTVTVKDATPGQFNLIAKDFCDYYKETFSNDNIIVVEDERSMYFEDIGNERFIGFENCPAEAFLNFFINSILSKANCLNSFISPLFISISIPYKNL